MERQYWASVGTGKKRVGPCATREEAVTLCRETFPLSKSQRAKRTGLHMGHIGRIMSGYGNGGMYFDIRWHDAEKDD